MKISFDKISATPLKFITENDSLKFSGSLSRKASGEVLLLGTVAGEFSHFCDSCGDEILLNLDEKIELILNKGIYKDDEHKVLDVIEIFSDEINLDEIFISEIEAYKSDYFYCEKCSKSM